MNSYMMCDDNSIYDNHEDIVIHNIEEFVNQQDNKIKELKQQLAITEKALESACKQFKEDCDISDSLEEIVKYFKTKAKEMMKSE